MNIDDGKKKNVPHVHNFYKKNSGLLDLSFPLRRLRSYKEASTSRTGQPVEMPGRDASSCQWDFWGFSTWKWWGSQCQNQKNCHPKKILVKIRKFTQKSNMAIENYVRWWFDHVNAKQKPQFIGEFSLPCLIAEGYNDVINKIGDSSKFATFVGMGQIWRHPQIDGQVDSCWV